MSCNSTVEKHGIHKMASWKKTKWHMTIFFMNLLNMLTAMYSHHLYVMWLIWRWVKHANDVAFSPPGSSPFNCSRCVEDSTPLFWHISWALIHVLDPDPNLVPCMLSGVNVCFQKVDVVKRSCYNQNLISANAPEIPHPCTKPSICQPVNEMYTLLWRDRAVVTPTPHDAYMRQCIESPFSQVMSIWILSVLNYYH